MNLSPNDLFLVEMSVQGTGLQTSGLQRGLNAASCTYSILIFMVCSLLFISSSIYALIHYSFINACMH